MKLVSPLSEKAKQVQVVMSMETVRVVMQSVIATINVKNMSPVAEKELGHMTM